MPAAADVKNRRTWPRKTPRTSAKVECRRGTLGLGPNLGVAFLDISEAGVRLIVSASFEVGEEVEVVIRDYGQRSAIKRVGAVCWCLPLQDGRFCVGLKFEKWVPFSEIRQLAKP